LPSAHTGQETNAPAAASKTQSQLDVHLVALLLQVTTAKTTIRRDSTTTLLIQLMEPVLTFILIQQSQDTLNAMKVVTSLPTKIKNKV